MPLSKQLAKHLHDVYFGGNWTTTSFSQVLKDTNWELATRQHLAFNSIATLVQHSSYYVGVLMDVLNDRPLTAKDELSFAHPAICNQQDWDTFLETVLNNAKEASLLLAQLPDEKLGEVFVDAKYGTYYRNIAGITEHLHYHLGQIVILKKLLATQNNNS